ncbi:MAG: hypothetical protein HKM24_04445 [Gammaproteobacteria bacterium]|nr:hypothetical protein [Gammaproteobacteria bacterium]
MVFRIPTLDSSNPLVNKAVFTGIIGVALTTAIVLSVVEVSWKSSIGRLLKPRNQSPLINNNTCP